MLLALREANNAVQRSGAALAVAFLLLVMGANAINKMLPTILNGVRDDEPQVILPIFDSKF